MKNIIAILFITIMMAGCTSGNPMINETSPQIIKKDKVSDNKVNNVIRFKVDDQYVETSGWAISRFMWNNDPSRLRLNITSNMHDEKRTINVNLDGAVAGEYNFGELSNRENQSHGSFFPDYIGDMANSFSFINGSFRIIEIDTVRGIINGSFFGTAKNLKGETIEISDGEIINAELNRGVRRY